MGSNALSTTARNGSGLRPYGQQTHIGAQLIQRAPHRYASMVAIQRGMRLLKDLAQPDITELPARCRTRDSVIAPMDAILSTGSRHDHDQSDGQASRRNLANVRQQSGDPRVGHPGVAGTVGGAQPVTDVPHRPAGGQCG